MIAAKPVVPVRGPEGVAAQVRSGAVAPIDFAVPPEAERLARVEATGLLRDDMPTKHLVDPGTAPGESAGGAEDRGIGVGDPGMAPGSGRDPTSHAAAWYTPLLVANRVMLASMLQ